MTKIRIIRWGHVSQFRRWLAAAMVVAGATLVVVGWGQEKESDYRRLSMIGNASMALGLIVALTNLKRPNQ